MPARSDADICNLALVYAGVNQKIGSLTDKSAVAQACNTIYAEMRRKVLSAFRWPHAIKRVQLVPISGSTYDSTHPYAVGDTAQFGNNVYRCIVAGTNHQPDTSTSYWVQVTRDGWAYVCPLPDDTLNLISVWEKPTVSANGSPQIFFFDKDLSGANLRNPRSSGRLPFTLENSNDGTDDQWLLTDLDTPILKYVAEVTNPVMFPSTFVNSLAWELAGPLCMALRGDEKKAASCIKMAAVITGDAFISAMRDQQEDEEPISEFEASREGVP